MCVARDDGSVAWRLCDHDPRRDAGRGHGDARAQPVEWTGNVLGGTAAGGTDEDCFDADGKPDPTPAVTSST